MQDLSKDVKEYNNNKAGEFEKGFEESVSSDGEDDFFFDSLDDDFGALSSKNKKEDSTDSSKIAAINVGSNINNNQNNIGSNQQQGGVNNKLYEIANKFGETAIDVTINAVKSTRFINNSEMADIFASMIKSSAIMIVFSVIFIIVDKITGVKIDGIIKSIFISGISCVGISIFGMGICSIVADNSSNEEKVEQTENTRILEDSEDLIDWFNDSDNEDVEEESDDYDIFEDLDNDNDNNKENIWEDEDWKIAGNYVVENSVLSREYLVDMLKNMIPKMNRNFGAVTELHNIDENYQTLEVMCKKAVANIVGIEMNEVKAEVNSIKESEYSYEIYMDRVKKVKKIEDLETEINYYARTDSSEKQVSTKVCIEGDQFKIVINKGKAILTSVGDILSNDKYNKEMKSDKYKMPIIIGIDNLGNAIIADFATYDSLMISGLARSGKSWCLVVILVTLCALNKPTDLQLIIIDPKESNLLKNVGLLPHTASVQNDKNILEVCRELLYKEAPRRKKVFEENKVDTIWELRKKGIEMPIIVLVVDEYITARNNLSVEDRKEFNELTLSMLTQLPSLGIKILLVPHRTVGIVDKTLRSLISFSAAVRAKQADVVDALGIKDWRIPLVNPGDMALKTNDMEEAIFVRNPVMASSDSELNTVIRNIATAFYKMGVEVPESIEHLRFGYTRNDIEVFDELGLDKSRLLQGRVDEKTSDKIGINDILNSI